MAIRFRKSVKIIPGVRLNIGKKGISTSIGGRGATLNISKRGTRITGGLPGTGLSASHLYKSPAKKKRVSAPPPEYSPAEWAVAAISLEVVALLFWKHLSGSLSFAGAAIALIIPGIYIARWIIRHREEALMAKELAELARERAEIEAKATPRPAVRDGSLSHPGKHWSEIVKSHDARSKPPQPIAPCDPPTSTASPLAAQALVGGKPTYELAASGKHDIEVMRECCEAEAANYWRQPEGERMCAAPYYFDRLAILHRKAKNYASEIETCEIWKAIINDYKRQPMVKARRAALVHKGPRSAAILARIPKAKELLRKQKAAARSAPKK